MAFKILDLEEVRLLNAIVIKGINTPHLENSQQTK